MDVRLPIDVVPNTDPPKFRWKQLVDTPVGKQVVDHEGSLPATVEVAVARLIGISKQLLMDNVALQGQIAGLKDQGQHAKAVPKVETKPAPTKK